MSRSTTPIPISSPSMAKPPRTFPSPSGPFLGSQNYHRHQQHPGVHDHAQADGGPAVWRLAGEPAVQLWPQQHHRFPTDRSIRRCCHNRCAGRPSPAFCRPRWSPARSRRQCGGSLQSDSPAIPWLSTRLSNTGSYGKAIQHQIQYGGSANGTLFDLPGGAVKASIGGQWAFDDYVANWNTAWPIGAIAGPPAPGSQVAVARPHRITNTGFAEINVPIVGKDNEMPFVHALTFNVSGRLDSYSDFGNTANYKLGITYEPFAALTIRATNGTSYRRAQPGRHRGAGYAFQLYRPAHLREHQRAAGHVGGGRAAALHQHTGRQSAAGAGNRQDLVDRRRFPSHHRVRPGPDRPRYQHHGFPYQVRTSAGPDPQQPPGVVLRLL